MMIVLLKVYLVTGGKSIADEPLDSTEILKAGGLCSENSCCQAVFPGFAHVSKRSKKLAHCQMYTFFVAQKLSNLPLFCQIFTLFTIKWFKMLFSPCSGLF